MLRQDARFLRRQGVGRFRRLEMKALWVQDHVKTGRVSVEKVDGTQNQADLGAKTLDEKMFV